MKKFVFAFFIVLGVSVMTANAQYVRTKPSFSIGISVGSHGQPPFSGAIWVGPEWQYRSGRYVEVPGYWSRPRRSYNSYSEGQWEERNGKYRWHKGTWRRDNDRNHDNRSRY